MDVPKQLCTFYLDGLFFGIDVLKVQEIILFQEMTPVPLAPPVIRGLINLRGQVVTAMDLRRRLGLPERAAGQEPMNVIIHTEDDDTLSFLVDDIGDVVSPEDDAFEAPPETLDATVRQVVSGVFKLDRQLLLVMDAEKTKTLSAQA